MKILLSIIFLFTITNLQADLIIKRKKNFNSCQEVYETGNYKGDGYYKIRKDGTLQDVRCKQDTQLKKEYNYYNGIAGQILNWEYTQRSCGIDQNENRVAVYHGYATCITTAKTRINYRDNDIIEIEFNIQRLPYGSSYHNQFIAFGILNYQYLRGNYSRISIGDVNLNNSNTDYYDIDSLEDNKIKILKENNKYKYYLNEQLVAENEYEFTSNNSNFIAMSNNSNIKIYNINVKIYEKIYIEDSN